ncbi:MAG TPA: DUF4115 domain-containing protein [Geobacter sp.]|nr:DUF4115 domain-containing protein [Geobacter sp.]
MPVGEYLRGVREAKGLQLDDAARVTKIGKSYLIAIEEGEFEKLPNAAYIKGFLRLYAGYLALSGDDVVARYERGLPAAPRPQAETARQGAPGMEAVERAKLGGRNRWLIPTLLLALVIVAAFFLSEGEQKPPPQPAAPAPPPVPVQAPVTAPIQKPSSSAKSDAVAPGFTEPPTAAAPAGKQSGIVLRLRFTRDSWLSITIDDSISQRYDLKAGDIIEWKGQRLFVLELGDGGAVEAEFNGKPLKSLGEPGKPAHVELKGEQQKP